MLTTGIDGIIDRYNKTETLTPSELERFDFLMIGTYSGNLKQIVQANYSTHHRVMFAVPAFHRFSLRSAQSLPFEDLELQ